MEQKIMKVGSQEYPIAGYVTTKQHGALPLADIPMMSDYRWHQLGLKSRLETPELYRAAGEDVETVITELRETLARYDACREIIA